MRKADLTYPQLLSSINVGSGVAEDDVSLEGTFVQTRDFDNLFSGKRDLFLGVKGSGKSALFLAALNRPPADVQLIPAQPLTGPTIHDSEILTPDSHNLEDYLTERWLVYSALLCAKNLGIDEHAVRPGHYAQLDEIFADERHLHNRDLWIRSYRIIKNEEISGIDFVHDIFSGLSTSLRNSGKSAWLCFDRLDDVTFYDPILELTHVRALLRAHVHLSRGTYAIKPKTFLRSDLMRRALSERPLRNLDKIPQLTLNMNATDISRLIVKRFALSDEFARHYLKGKRDVIGQDLRDALKSILPARRNPKKPYETIHDLFGHLFRGTMDGSERYSPRSVLSLLRHALSEEINECERHGRMRLPNDSPLLSKRSLDRAWIQTGEERLASYVFAEFPNLRPFIERLEKGPVTYDGLTPLRQQLFGGAATNQEAGQVIDHLVHCGVLGRTGGSYFVAPIYRPALRSRRQSKAY